MGITAGLEVIREKELLSLPRTITKWQPTSGFLLGKSHGQRSLVGYSPWNCKELVMTEVTLAHAHMHICFIGLSKQFMTQKRCSHKVKK